MNSFSERAIKAREAKETYRVDNGRLCICRDCGQPHFIDPRKETNGLQNNETETGGSVSEGTSPEDLR